ncbi:hypothetical protein [Embleya sp. NPDC001921]
MTEPARTSTNACGTCRDRTASGWDAEHEECHPRARLIFAPDAPAYEDLADLSAAARAALPARFHIPVFVDAVTPKGWVCAVCWGESWSTSWPCATASEHGALVFDPQH